jgi:uncharacterized membrane protein
VVTSAARSSASLASRVASVDVVRGAVMLLMALDHVRLYLTNANVDPMDLSQTTVPLFLTRWITHFCAPAFVFLAGSAAFLRGRKTGPASLSRFLLVRGIWLILLEITVLRLGWTFNFDYRHYVLAGVIWMIGWVMIGLALLVYFPTPVIGTLGLAILFGHNVLDRVLPPHMAAIQASSLKWLWQVLYFGGPVPVGDLTVLAVLYSLVPWIGVIAAGYAFGAVLTWPDGRRRLACLGIGLAAIALFLLLRGWNVYGNASPWKPQASAAFTVLSFVNTRKYPASLLFLLMTLGPTILAVPLAERLRGRAGAFLQVFGRVPLFFYVLHIWLAHVVAAVLSVVRYGSVIPWMFANHPFWPGPHPEGYGYGLGVVWLTTALVILALYVPCRWFAARKAENPGSLLSFL